jgi:ribonuclease PH
MMRIDGRMYNEIRKTEIIPNYIKCAEGSALIMMGDTRIICTATIEDKVPFFLKNSGQGWLACEYGMLPRSSSTRIVREINVGRPAGRSQEIQRMVGRALRSVVDLYALGERTIWIDCDVIEADGGTRTASITGGFVALALAANWLIQQQLSKYIIINNMVAAVSAGIVDQQPLLDMTFQEDSKAEVDFNIAMNGSGKIIEIQSTAEKTPFTIDQLNELTKLAQQGLHSLFILQKQILKPLISEECYIKMTQDCSLGDTV